MKMIKGLGIFLVQFIGLWVLFNILVGIVQWVVGLGYKVLQIFCNYLVIFDVEWVVVSQIYCDEVSGILVEYGLVISELFIYFEGQLVVVYLVYDVVFDVFVLVVLYGDLQVCQCWVVEKVCQVVVVFGCLGLQVYVIFFGVLVWFFFYLWLLYNQLFLDEVFVELVWCWWLLLDFFDEQGVDVCYEIYFGEDLYDGVIFECFFVLVDNYLCCNMFYDLSYLYLQQMDYLIYIDIYYVCIKVFYVKDVEFCCNGCNGVYGGYQFWQQWVGCFCFFGDGQIDFKGVFSKLIEYDFVGWVVLEWECCLKDSEIGVCEGSEFICCYIIFVVGWVFDDFVVGGRE